jgi:hypothetical protein
MWSPCLRIMKLLVMRFLHPPIIYSRLIQNIRPIMQSRNINTFTNLLLLSCISLLWRKSPTRGRASSLLRFRDHTQTHHPPSDFSGGGVDLLQRLLADNIRESQDIDIHAFGEIRFRNPSKRAAAEALLRPGDDDDQRLFISFIDS